MPCSTRSSSQSEKKTVSIFHSSLFTHQDDKDFMYEEQVLKDPYQFKSWWHYLDAKKDAPAQVCFAVFEFLV